MDCPTTHPSASVRRAFRPWRHRRRLVLGALAALLLASGPLRAEIDFTQLSLDELGEIRISTLERRSEPLFDTPAAVSVLRAPDILRAGDASVADALRLIPGLNVAQLNPDKWEIGVRGFNGVTSTKLLVMVDGMNLYSPYYGGVDWALADVPVEDVDQVEVVRGPGATLWGVNAVNGIVSVTTKSARDTLGALVSVREGSTAGLVSYARYGAALGRHAWVRVYARAIDSNTATPRSNTPGPTPFRQVRTGVRVDADETDRLHFTWQADYLLEDNQPQLNDPRSASAREYDNWYDHGDVLGRMTWKGGAAGTLTVQTYVDHGGDHVAGIPSLGGGTLALSQSGTDYDLDVSDDLRHGRHDLVWGGGARSTQFDIAARYGIQVRQPTGTENRYNFFAQDEYTLLPDTLKFTYGTKFEHHESIGWQVLPSVRLAWTPGSRQTWWAAVSRAVRAPSRSERDIFMPLAQLPGSPTSPPVDVNLVGTTATREEVLTAYEAGWRFRPQPRLTFDCTAYVNDYTQLRNLAPVVSFQAAPPAVIDNLTIDNSLRAVGYGVEGQANWRVSDTWRLNAGVTEERLQPRGTPVTALVAADFALPDLMWNAGTWVALPHDVEFSTEVYRVGGMTHTTVPGYFRADAQLTWRPIAELELNVGVQNAFEPTHLEYGTASLYPIAPVDRNFFARVQWRF